MAVLMTSTPRVPLLCAGDRLTRDEFERRYTAMPDLKKAELVEGVVYMGSPVRHRQHGRPHALLAGWLTRYEAHTPGLMTSDNASLRLDLDNELQPDLLLALPQHAGGRLRVTQGGWLEGAPELVVEIAASSASYDLHDKLRAYRRNGVREYVVWRTEDQAIDWFSLEHGTYVEQHPVAGQHRCRTFPGLWLHIDAALQGDVAALHAAVDAGCATAEHRAFLPTLSS
ncbi:MAG: Uma2 family endonuclease [Planctomycetes bacterium]|nr:Uma2 family endonuclease [Planctomycetota bacterium]